MRESHSEEWEHARSVWPNGEWPKTRRVRKLFLIAMKVCLCVRV